MQYVRSIGGSVSKTWNSINPATLSGAIDVIVVEHDDGTLACSPFHVRFGKFSLLRPSEKKVEFRVNNAKQDFSMKLGEGGEAFFVFETSDSIPEALQTSPLVSPANSPETRPTTPRSTSDLSEVEPLDLAAESTRRELESSPISSKRLTIDVDQLNQLPSPSVSRRSMSGDWSGTLRPPVTPLVDRAATEQVLPTTKESIAKSFGQPRSFTTIGQDVENPPERSSSPPPVSKREAYERAITLSKRLWGSNIPAQVTETGDLKLDMTGYKSSEEEALRAEVIARKILSEELEGDYDIGALIGVDEHGNLWIYGSEEAKEEADRKISLQGLQGTALRSSDAISDPGYQSDDARSDTGSDLHAGMHIRRDSDSALGMSSPAKLAEAHKTAGHPNRNYAKTLRLSSDQLKALHLKPGANTMSFSVNRATCTACMYLWKHETPIVISDIDGTITKSDALGHVLNMIGRDWTHLGVAKLYTDISANGYNIIYLTSRSVGQADTTRGYLNGIVQEGYRLPKGPVIMSPDRTIAALRREVYLRKPEVFKMACLRDIMSLFIQGTNPFYAGFGNRLTDALSYRSVNIPSTRIFTINSNAEVSLDLLSLNKYKTGYVSMRELIDQFFPSVGLLVQNGGEDFTDFTFWRDRPLELDEFSDSEDEDLPPNRLSVQSEDLALEMNASVDDLEASYMSRESVDISGRVDGVLDSQADLEDSIIHDDDDNLELADDEDDDEDGEEEEEDEGSDEEDDEEDEDEEVDAVAHEFAHATLANESRQRSVARKA